MENKSLASQLADNLNRNLIIEHLVEREGADLETYLRMLPLDVLRQLDDDVEALDRKEANKT